MITDADLAAAVADRPHWQPTGADRERYLASIIQDGQAAYTMPCYTAVEAVWWAERYGRP